MSIFNTPVRPESVLMTDQNIGPNIEILPNGMSRTPEFYMRMMQTSSDMSVQSTKNAKGK